MEHIAISAQNDFELSNQASFIAWLKRCMNLLQMQMGEIHISLMSDEGLLEINKKHLNHDDYTDVITFDYSTQNTIHCDIAISTDRVSENAHNEGVSVENELARVMIHGILHCVGFNDKTEDDKRIMRSKENELLKLFHVEQKSTPSDV
ncbi:MAG: rRNA maturation RNase YbeY [Flavobacteriaceae bacterium]